MIRERRESFRRWATLIASVLAALATALRDPIALTLRNKENEILRRELGRYENLAASEAQLARHLEVQNEAFGRLDRAMALLRDEAVANGSNHKLLFEIHGCLVLLETKLDLLFKDTQRGRQPLTKPTD